MEEKLLDLKDLLKVDEQTKILSCLGQRVTIADSISRGLLKKELIQIFGSYGAKNVLTRYGYAHGWRTAEMLKTRFPNFFIIQMEGRNSICCMAWSIRPGLRKAQVKGRIL